MTAAACMENNNNSGTISVKADIFSAGGRGDGGRKEGRVKAHSAIPNLRPNQWRDWHRFPLARSRRHGQRGPREAQIHLALCCISLGKPRVLHLQQQAMALALAESQAWRRGH